MAIVGPPNSGKSTLFNRLTGLRQKVANFPGVTVEHRMGKVKGQRHVIAGFVSGVTKHHSLVAGSLVFFFHALHALVNVGRLFVDRRKYAA